ncbi:MAG: amidophosphoribosyltransferase [Candidatus Nanohalarchaeota archaeon]|nr:MAG: amidophosphoribosyltransferase [Candidatus Nanohaloarchaeota archaeon]
MCSIVGIASGEKKQDVSYELYNALICLQHRGQDAAGIATAGPDEKIHVKKKKGLVFEFTKKNLNHLTGNFGIGHTRYSTAGSSKIENAHPYIINYPTSIAIASNGDTRNYNELKQFLHNQGICLQTDCDIEVMAKLFACQYLKSKDVFESVTFLMKKVIGAYSVVCLIQNKGLLAFRDPYGIRPLVMGQKSSQDKSFMFASESAPLDIGGYKFTCNVKPGEAIFIDRDLKCNRKMIVEKTKKAHCMFEWVYLARPDSDIENLSVYRSRENMGKIMGKIAKSMNYVDPESVVVPVPDSGRSAAIAFAEETDMKYRDYIIKNRYIARTFIMETGKMRAKNIKLKLNASQGVAGKIIFLIDDSIVRGTTAKQIVKMLKSKGAKKIIFVSACPKLISTCKYGINISTKEELIAHGKTVDEIRKEIGADELIYPSLDNLKEALGMDELCMGCLSGKYPHNAE